MGRGKPEMSPAEREYLAALRQQIAETRLLFSNAQKPEREKMVCRAFLRSMGVGFSEAEISVGASEPTDIAFRGAAFQITEVLDEGRRRSLEHKELEIKYKNARSARDVMEPWRNPEAMGFPEMVSVTAKRLEEKFAKLGQQGCRGIDALVYIDRLKPVVRYLHPAMFIETNDANTMRAHGWRSVSVLMVPYATVLFAAETAPSFLRCHQGVVLRAADDVVSQLFAV
jgi:hypothetical protein